jgi:hypothetical protein
MAAFSVSVRCYSKTPFSVVYGTRICKSTVCVTLCTPRAACNENTSIVACTLQSNYRLLGVYCKLL